MIRGRRDYRQPCQVVCGDAQAPFQLMSGCPRIVIQSATPHHIDQAAAAERDRSHSAYHIQGHAGSPAIQSGVAVAVTYLAVGTLLHVATDETAFWDTAPCLVKRVYMSMTMQWADILVMLEFVGH